MLISATTGRTSLEFAAKELLLLRMEDMYVYLWNKLFLFGPLASMDLGNGPKWQACI